MYITLRHFADLFSGIYVNTSTSKGGSVYYLQVGHWDKERNWARYIEPMLCEENRLYKNYLEIGDLLLATKGIDRSAMLYDGRYTPAIASSVFTVLRIRDTNTVLPEYLQWYLNHPATTRKLAAAAIGTSIPLITRDVIEQLEVAIPSLERQRMILMAQSLQQQAMQLRSRINQLDETIFHYNMLKTAHRQ